MVDVGRKEVSRRTATAEAWVEVGPEIARMLREAGEVPKGVPRDPASEAAAGAGAGPTVPRSKGNVLETARVAGILGAKRTAELIPLCHPISLDAIEVEAHVEGERIHIVTRTGAEEKTGVEMEALVAASVAALTVYDMVKSVQKGVSIGPVRLIEKEGGRSGAWRRSDASGR